MTSNMPYFFNLQSLPLLTSYHNKREELRFLVFLKCFIQILTGKKDKMDSIFIYSGYHWQNIWTYELAKQTELS